MPRCGSQCILCDVPVRFDTYVGCSHACSYCFVNRKKDISKIELNESPQQLRDFINGKRTLETKWCDWKIPLHIGGMSDPFQPCEKIHKRTLECLKVLAETKYPFIISTKNTLQASKEYLDVLKDCNFVFQESMVCSKFDEWEKGAPSFEERLKAIEIMGKVAKRTIVRCQPWVPQVQSDIIKNLPRYKKAGVYGVIFESMKYGQKKPHTVKFYGDNVYEKEYLIPYWQQLKSECHKNGLVFLSGENRLRTMGDSLTCCGCEGLEDFKVSTFNLNSIKGKRDMEITEGMNVIYSGSCLKTLEQTNVMYQRIKTKSYRDVAEWYMNNHLDIVQ